MLVEALTNSVEHPRTYVPLIPQPTLQPRAVARRLRVEGGAWRASDLIRLAEKGGSLVRSDWLGGWLAGAPLTMSISVIWPRLTNSLMVLGLGLGARAWAWVRVAVRVRVRVQERVMVQ